MLGGVPAGASTAYQNVTSKSVRPCSCRVGTSGAAVTRLLSAVPSRRTWPCLAIGMITWIAWNAASTVAADQVLRRAGGAAIRNVLQVGLGDELEQLHREMMR